MPFYKSIDYKTEVGKRTAERLMDLKSALDGAIPVKQTDKTLLLATWNIREFGGKKSGGRDDGETLYYLAEIISRFDLVAVQEVRDNLDALDRLMYILGRWWKYLVSDVTVGPQGNNERLAYIYDTRKMTFGGLAGELAPEAKKGEDGLSAEFSFARSPFPCRFQAGWFKFTICTDHLYYGDPNPDDPQRVKEAQKIVDLLKKRITAKDSWAYNTILVGDFNIFSTEDKTFLALKDGNYQVAPALAGKYTNAARNKPFDQIFFLANGLDQQVKLDQVKADVFPFFDYVYRDEDAAIYLKGNLEANYKQWRTYKMSDHLPVWVELNVDFGEAYLRRKLKEAAPAGG